MAKQKSIGIGHNSGAINGDELKKIIQEVEEGEENKAAWAEQIKEVYAVAKAKGFDPKMIKKVIAARKADREKLKLDKEILVQYAFAIDPDLAEALS